MNCALCDAGPDDHILIASQDRTGSALRTVICGKCGLGFSNPMPTEEETEAFYSSRYRQSYKGASSPKPRHILRAARSAVGRYNGLRQFHFGSGKVVDLGASSGEVLYLFRRAGFKSYGIEPNKAYAEYARQSYGLDIHAGSYISAQIEDGSCDLVTSFHVFEHLVDPNEAFAAVRKMLKPGGIFVIEVPRLDSTAQSFRSRFHFAHVHHFTDATMVAFAKKHGFSVHTDQPAKDGVVRFAFLADAKPCSSENACTAIEPGDIAALQTLLNNTGTVHKKTFLHARKKLLRGIEGRIATLGKTSREVALSVLDKAKLD